MLKRLLGSLGAISVGQLVNVGANLLLVPLFLSRWNKAAYGEWLTLSALVAYLCAMDLGLNAAVGNEMTAAYSRGDVKRFARLHGSAMAYYVILALSVSLVLAIICLTLPIGQWFALRSISHRTAAVVVLLLGTRLIWELPVAQVVWTYRTTGNLAASQWIYNGQALGRAAATAIVLWLGGGVLAVTVWSSCPLVLSGAAVWCMLRRSHPELLPRLREANSSGLKELVNPSILFGAMNLATALCFQAPVLLVSAVMGGGAVAALVTTRTLTSVIRQMTGMLASAAWPELTRLHAAGASYILQAAHRLLTTVMTVVSAAFAGTLWFEGSEVIAVWTRGKIEPDPWLLRLFLLSLVLQAPWLASSIFTIACNRHRRLAVACCASAVVSVITAAILLKHMGLAAVPAGVLIGEGLACYHFVVQDTCCVLHCSYSAFARRMFLATAAIFGAAYCAGWCAHSFAIGPAPLRWVESGMLTTAVCGLVAWGTSVAHADRQLLKSSLRTQQLSWAGHRLPFELGSGSGLASE